MALSFFVIILIAFIVLVFVTFAALSARYKRCPSDKILVVYGRTGKHADGGTRSATCIHGGAAFIWPVIQSYAWLDLTPISLEANLTNALSRQNIRVDVPSRFTVGISTDPEIMNNAAERLLGIAMPQVQELAKDIIFGQLRLVIATMNIEEINSDRDKFLTNVADNVDSELKKIGLKLINVNVTDIRDESGYIEALGKEAAAKAINDAKKSVAEKSRDGAIGEANAKMDERVQVSSAVADAKIGEADADRKERIQIAEAVAQAKIGEADAHKTERIEVSDANARAVEGENSAKIAIAQSDSLRREREAEATSKAVSSEKIQAAKALEGSYSAERDAEDRRADRDRSTRKADIIVPAEIRKEEVAIQAEAEAERIRRIARGEADAIFMKKEAEARGMYEILSKQAEGFDKLVKSAGDNSRDAVLFMIADQLPELVKLQVDAIKNIKIDKVTVWDSGGNGAEGGSTANFISNLYKSVPPLEGVFKMAGMDLPDYLGKTGKNGGSKGGDGGEPDIVTPIVIDKN
jgi:flotillin